MSSLATLFDPPTDATSEELRARLRALADLIARAPVPIAIAHDPACRFISANEALARLLGLPASANISLAPRDRKFAIDTLKLFANRGRGTAGGLFFGHRAMGCRRGQTK